MKFFNGLGFPLVLIIVAFLGFFIVNGCTATTPELPSPTPTATFTPTPTPEVGFLISAVYSDVNQSGKVDEGDTITLSFDQPIEPLSLSIIAFDDFHIESIGVTESVVNWNGFSDFKGDNYQIVQIELMGKIENLIPGKSVINVKQGALGTKEGGIVCWKPVRILPFLKIINSITPVPVQ